MDGLQAHCWLPGTRRRDTQPPATEFTKYSSAAAPERWLWRHRDKLKVPGKGTLAAGLAPGQSQGQLQMAESLGSRHGVQSEHRIPENSQPSWGKEIQCCSGSREQKWKERCKSVMKQAPASVLPTGSSLHSWTRAPEAEAPREWEFCGPRAAACQRKTKFASRIFFRHFARCTASLTIFNVLTAWSSELINWCWSDQ